MLGRSNPTHIYIRASGGPFNISDKLLIRYQDIHKTRSKFNKFISKESIEIIFAASGCSIVAECWGGATQHISIFVLLVVPLILVTNS